MISRERDALLETIEACRRYFVNPVGENLENALVAVAKSTGGPVTPPKSFVVDHKSELSAGEQAVWAAVFTKEDSIHNPPRGMAMPGNAQAWHEWEISQTVAAIEAAGGAVVRLRQSRQATLDGFGQDDETTIFLEQMLRHKGDTT